MQPATPITSDRLTVISWPDQIADATGHDPRSQYVERYWLPVLGPTATWILRRLTEELEGNPKGFIMDMAEMARCLGVGGTGLNSAFARAIVRLVQFEVACMAEPEVLAIRRTLPALGRRHLLRLPESMQRHHQYYVTTAASSS